MPSKVLHVTFLLLLQIQQHSCTCHALQSTPLVAARKHPCRASPNCTPEHSVSWLVSLPHSCACSATCKRVRSRSKCRAAAGLQYKLQSIYCKIAHVAYN